jgi:hypothetical protein
MNSYLKTTVGKKLIAPMMLFIVSISFLTGCASGPAFQEVSIVPEGKSIVYFYRPAKYYSGASSPEIYDNGNLILDGLTNGGYWVYYITPGKHVFSTKATFVDSTSISLESKGPGEEYYVRLELTWDFFVPDAKLFRIYPDQGRQEIMSCKLVK